MRRTVNSDPIVDTGQRLGVGLDVGRARDRVAVRTGGRVAEQPVDRLLDVVAHHVLPLAGLVVRFGPRQRQHVGQEALGEAVPAHHTLGELDAARGELDHAVVGEQALRFESLDHLAHCWAADQEPIGDPGLDDVDVVFGQLEDALAVFLERRVVLSGCGHAPSLLRRQLGGGGSVGR